MSGERYTPTGHDGRTCPTCYRDNALLGLRQGDQPKLTCRGCGNRFSLTWGVDGSRDTLTRLDEPAPAVAYYPVGEKR